MGNINKKINDQDTDDEGQLDYEHAYSFHKKVLQQGQSSEFESDDEEFSDVPSSPTDPAAEVKEGTNMTDALCCLHPNFDGGESKSVLCNQENALEGEDMLGQNSACIPTDEGVSECQVFGEGQSVTHNVLEGSGEDHSIRTPGSGCTTQAAPAHDAAVLQPDPDDVYETATEGSKKDKGNDSDEDSLSTVTPPCTRPQSDSESECSLDAYSGTEEDASGSETQDIEDARSSFMVNGPVRRSRSDLSGLAGDRHSPGLQPSAHIDAKTLTARYHRKRCASPSFSEDHYLPAKQQKLLMSKHSSPTKVQYRYPDSDSEFEDDKVHHAIARKEKEIPISVCGRKQSASLSARTIRIAARQAASRFIRTSRRILKDAKMAARAIKRYSFEKRAAKTLTPEKAKPSTSEHSQTVRGGQEAQASISETEVLVIETNRKPAGFRVHDDIGEFDPDESISEVRKNGGFGRKFTPSNATKSSSTQSVNLHSASMPSMPREKASADAESHHLPSVRHPSCKTVESVSPSTSGFQHNPLQNIHLVPLSVQQSSNSAHGSTDSINSELVQPLQMSACDSPFTCISAKTTEIDASLPVTFTSSSVWARVNMRNTNSQHSDSHSGILKVTSEASSTSGQRMGTRNRPQTLECNLEVPFPRQKTPRVPSLTLSGQFAQSGRFAFLLEDTVQVTVTTADITVTTASAVVIPTNKQLQHSSQMARSVVAKAGPTLTHACQEFLKRQSHGLRECEVLDTPAGGSLSQLTTHILHVVVPEKSDFGRQKKMLLCTYLNCMKHADEKLHLQSIAVPLLGAGAYPADMDLHVFFDSLLIFLAECTHSSRLHAVQLVLNHPAVARFAAEVLEARLETLTLSGVDAALQSAFQEYFGIPNFTREHPSKTSPCPDDRRPNGKPAIKRRRL